MNALRKIALNPDVLPNILFRGKVNAVAVSKCADVCVGTGWKDDRRHYLTRPKAVGDPHGQAPMLWLCAALAVFE